MNSVCKGLTEEKCNETPDCKYTTGTRKYCRVKKNNTPTKKRIPPIIQKETKKYTRKKMKKYTQKDRIQAAEKITQFFKKTGHKRNILFLKSICADSGACISFGKEIDKINAFFNYYTRFEYAIPPIKKIGQLSANGFIKEITYERDGYLGHAVLKSSIKKNADNLMYEYEVGQFMNENIRSLPNFLETYGLYHYKNNTSWNYIKNTKKMNPKVFKDKLILLHDIDYRVGCPDSQYIAILTQHVDNAISIREFIANSIPDDINGNLPYILYQIYFSLFILKSVFTHYDLHDENVLLYKPVNGSYITYHYHLQNGNIVEFKSQYIAKIIDYGRSYYYKNSSEESKNTYKNICLTNECDPKCGYNSGLAILGPEAGGPGSFYYITSQVNNQSHDLRLMHYMKYRLKDKPVGITKTFTNLFNKLVYKTNYGTNEIRASGLPGAIHNVTDAYKSLESLIRLSTYKKANDVYFSGYQKLGDFHIYENRQPMHFDKSV